MPRLQGERSNTALYIAIAVIVLLLVLLLLEYLGTVNLITGFGAR